MLKKQLSFYSCLLILFSTNSFAQSYYYGEEYWHKGVIMLSVKDEDHDSDTLQGELKYSLNNNMVLYKDLSVGSLKTLTTRKVLGFEFFDEYMGVNRTFYAFPYTVQYNNYEVPTFFELLHQGAFVSLLCRERLVVQTVANNNFGYSLSMAPITRTTVEDEYYLLYVYEKNDEVQLKIKTFSKKDELIKLLSDKSNLINQFMEENKLKIFNRNDLIQVVDYYNSLKE